MASLRCKLSGCDLDPCGICRRCGSQDAAKHDWKDVARKRPCYKRKECTRCNEFHESPDHDWTPTDGPGGAGIVLRCSRCDLAI